jgi:hypothetical protein
MKLPYETPGLTAIGTFEDVTQATMVGSVFDGDYSNGQPIPPTGAQGDPTS